MLKQISAIVDKIVYGVVMQKDSVQKAVGNTNESYPMRINKYLAHKGYSTRTGADEMIKKHMVSINGRVAVLGDKVTEKDVIEVKKSKRPEKYVYLAYNKPKGMVSTNPQGDEKAISGEVKYRVKVFPVGRLDKDSYGLIILSNDGRITDRLLNPDRAHEKQYIVQVDQKTSPAFLKHMSEGVTLGDEQTRPAKVKKIKEDSFEITLTEGKNRQIRRMTEKLGRTVIDLKRVRIQNIMLGQIKPGTYREILDDELHTFLLSLGLVS